MWGRCTPATTMSTTSDTPPARTTTATTTRLPHDPRTPGGTLAAPKRAATPMGVPALAAPPAARAVPTTTRCTVVVPTMAAPSVVDAWLGRTMRAIRLHARCSGGGRIYGNAQGLGSRGSRNGAVNDTGRLGILDGEAWRSPGCFCLCVTPRRSLNDIVVRRCRSKLPRTQYGITLRFDESVSHGGSFGVGGLNYTGRRVDRSLRQQASFGPLAYGSKV